MITSNFSLQIKTAVKIQGCPVPGWNGATALDALDFRRLHNIPDYRADNLILLERNFDDCEAEIRELVACGLHLPASNTEGRVQVQCVDGIFMTTFPRVFTATGTETAHGETYGWRAEVPPKLLVPQNRTGYSRAEVIAILKCIYQDTPLKQATREVQTTHLAELRAKISELSAEADALARQLEVR